MKGISWSKRLEVIDQLFNSPSKDYDTIAKQLAVSRHTVAKTAEELMHIGVVRSKRSPNNYKPTERILYNIGRLTDPPEQDKKVSDQQLVLIAEAVKTVADRVMELETRPDSKPLIIDVNGKKVKFDFETKEWIVPTE